MPTRAAIIRTSRSIVGQAMPWRAAARSTEPGIASSSGSRPAAMSRCMEVPKVSGMRLTYSIVVATSTSDAPSAKATAAASAIASSRAEIAWGVLLISPSSMS